MSDRTLPLFPLGTVLVPGQALPLHIFEPRYRRLIDDLMQGPDDAEIGRAFGVIGIREGHEVGADGVRALYAVGTTARLQSVQRYDDGRFDIMTFGERRFRLDTLLDGMPYALGEVTWIEELPGNDPGLLSGRVRDQLIAYRSELVGSGLLDDVDDDEIPSEPRALSYAVARGMILDRFDRQRMLECPDDRSRLDIGRTLLRRESAIAEAVPSVPAGDLARSDVCLN